MKCRHHVYHTSTLPTCRVNGTAFTGIPNTLRYLRLTRTAGQSPDCNCEQAISTENQFSTSLSAVAAAAGRVPAAPGQACCAVSCFSWTADQTSHTGTPSPAILRRWSEQMSWTGSHAPPPPIVACIYFHEWVSHHEPVTLLLRRQ